MSDRPRLLLVPTATELEWKIKPQLEEWADVASFDLPGVGAEPEPPELSPDAIAERGIAEIEGRGWERCVVVGDEVGAAQAARIADARPELVAGLALGHATLSFHADGERAPLNRAVLDALVQVSRTDYRGYVRALAQATQHAYDEEFVQAYMERVPKELANRYIELLLVRAEAEDLEPALRSLDVPMLLVEHRGCLLWTREGFEDAVAAFPAAETASYEVKPSVSAEFGERLRRFCEGLSFGRS